MSWPQITIICFFAMSLAIGLVKHGEPKHSEYNVFGTLLLIAIWATILWFGGFWK